ncbi:MAG: ATP synthase F1 subunit delta [Cyclobacteriaceae bacterium]
MSEFRVATRYAKSLLDLAIEQNALEDVHRDMQLFDQVCEQSRDFWLLLKNPIINHEKKLLVLEGLFKDKVHHMTASFFEIITRKNRESVLASIAKEFHRQYNVYKGVEEAVVTTTFPIDDQLRERFKEIVSQTDGTGDGGVELEEVVDGSLIGGFVLKIGGQQIDSSVQSKLKELKLKFSHNPYVREI